MNNALQELNLRDMKTILTALYEFHGTLKHDDEKALLVITVEKMQKAALEHNDWLYAQYATESN